MTPAALVWLFFLFVALRLVLKQRLPEASRQRMIARITPKRPARNYCVRKRRLDSSIDMPAA